MCAEVRERGLLELLEHWHIAVDKSREKGERGMEKTVIKHT